jgi:hypothetical protein
MIEIETPYPTYIEASSLSEIVDLGDDLPKD